MIYRFGSFELDLAKAELRAGGEIRRVEPQVFALIVLLVENRERLVSKDEIIEKVTNQRVLKTIHRRGFRFIADALPHELVVELSRLRLLLVTARGSSFRLRGADAGLCGIGRLLGVRYCPTGTVETKGARPAVAVDLLDTRDGGIVWAERFAGPLDDVQQIRGEIRSQILAALEIRIPLHEAAPARLTVTENLDAWSAYHLGLQHMYRFKRNDNAAAAALFEPARSRRPGASRRAASRDVGTSTSRCA